VTRSGSWRALPLLLLSSLCFAAPSEGEQEAARRAMLDKAGISVVGIRNEQGYGSGMVLDAQGTILTNAHVIVSPLPFHVEARVQEADRIRTVQYSKMVLIGVHPSRDLAIVRVDPAEHPGKLVPITISKDATASGNPVFAIGYPSTLGGVTKVCTSGEVTGLDKFVDMPGYFEFSAEVHTGNSGGPIVDQHGQALGVVTRGKTNGEPTAWAIPLHDFRPDQFVPLERRPKDPAKASRILRYAEDMLKIAKKGLKAGALISEELFQLALVEDISNPDTYFKIGMLQRADKAFSSATAYLMRSIQIQPWNDAKDLVYHELGACLVALNRIPDAVTVWNEAVAKYPGEASRVWDALAVTHYETARYLDAACASRASLRAFGDRAGKMNDIYDKARAKLDRDSISKLTEFESLIDSRVLEDRKMAEKACAAGRRFMTPACEKLTVSYDGIQKEAVGFNFSSLGKGPNAPKPIDIPDKDLVPLFIRSRIAVAGEHLQAGKLKLAADVLEDVIKTYPDHPDTESARDLLNLINKKK
jgi:tetratricopeptide (TPR) repeat protein